MLVFVFLCFALWYFNFLENSLEKINLLVQIRVGWPFKINNNNNKVQDSDQLTSSQVNASCSTKLVDSFLLIVRLFKCWLNPIESKTVNDQVINPPKNKQLQLYMRPLFQKKNQLHLLWAGLVYFFLSVLVFLRALAVKWWTGSVPMCLVCL